MTECIHGTPEVIEKNLGEALAYRSSSLDEYLHDLGPFDLCVILKDKEGLFKQQIKEGYYHWIVGLEPSGAVAACSYFSSLLKLQQSQRLLSLGSKHKASKATLCFWNAFSKLDLRVEITVPGGAKEYAVDCKADKHQVTPELWNETFLSCVLRAMGKLPLAPAIKVVSPTLTLGAERKAIDLAKKLFWQGHTLGTALNLPSTHINNNLVVTVFEYFYSTARFNELGNFISEFCEQEPGLTIYLSKIEQAKNNWERSNELVRQALAKKPQSAELLAEHARIRLHFHTQDDPEALMQAISDVREAIRIQPQDPYHTILLADLFVRCSEYSQALLALNRVPMISAVKHLSPSEDVDVQMLFPDPLPVILGAPKGGHDQVITEPDGVQRRVYWDDDLSEYESEEEDVLEGVEEVDKRLKNLQANFLRGVASDVYSTLVHILNAVGWEGLLDLRSEVFFMETDEDEKLLQEQRTAPSEGKPRKELLSRWFDRMIFLLYEDLKQMEQWRLEEEDMKRQQVDEAGKTGNQEEEDGAMGHIYDVLDRPSEDWYYRGRLAERLQRKRDAELAYRMSAFKAFNTRAHLRLLQLYAAHGVVKECLVVADILLTKLYYEDDDAEQLTRSTVCSETDKDLLRLPMHPQIRRAVFRLISLVGLAQVRRVQQSISRTVHPALNELFLDAVQIGVFGAESQT
eukprot:TRINITY_DN4976_c0_g1_i1.p1 TRINITY_DN4976_c0_g1~~TRINITY_DN4976_c0_g1_i1.p1  ORF type:complete len:687 (-),score=108.22 TRINITY_DN4976_c0_g1_i1:9-2069(-)